MKVKKFTGHICPNCDAFVPDISEKMVERFECGGCGEFYEDLADAGECCRE